MMTTTDTKTVADATYSLDALKFICDAARAAINARDAIDDCSSPEWRAAHKVAMGASFRKESALKVAYVEGVLPKPYWL